MRYALTLAVGMLIGAGIVASISLPPSPTAGAWCIDGSAPVVLDEAITVAYVKVLDTDPE